MKKFIFTGLIFCSAIGIAFGQSILNGSFETVNTAGSTSTLVNPASSVGNAAAENWYTFLYSPGVLNTNWVPAGTQAPLLTGQGNNMLEVSLTSATGGIYQNSNLAIGTTVTAEVYVVVGEVVLQSFDGNYDTSVIATPSNQWQKLSITTSFANASILVGNDSFNSGAVNSGPSMFYVDMVQVQAVPAPSSLIGLGIASLGLITLRRRRS